MKKKQKKSIQETKNKKIEKRTSNKSVGSLLRPYNHV